MAEETPTDAATADIDKAFRPGKFEHSKVHYCGGLLKKPMPLTTKKVPVHDGEKIFVKMSASEPWLIGAVTGQKTHGLLVRTRLLTTLHSFVELACNGELDTRAAEEEGGDEQKLEYDPMEEIEVDDDDNPRSRGVGYIDPNSKRARYQKNKAKNRLLTVTVPAVAPEQDPMSTSTRTIKLYVVDRKQVWLDLDDVEWALRVLYMQFVLKGVPVVSPDDAGPFLTPQKRRANDSW